MLFKWKNKYLVFVKYLALWNKWPLGKKKCLCGILSDLFQRYSTIECFLVPYRN